MSDTSEAAGEIQGNIQRRLGGPARLLLAYQMSLDVRTLALSRLRAQYPDRSDRELILALLRLEAPLRTNARGIV